MNEKEALLNQLRDVELPEVSAMPALGWWFLLLLFVVLLVALLYCHRRWRARLWQRQARLELQSIRDQLGNESSSALLSRCSQLARKVVLATDHREQIASLHGEPWLAKLDDVCGRPEFTQGIGRLLLDQPYKKQPLLAEKDLNALFGSVELLINSAARYRAAEPAPIQVRANNKHSTS